MPDISAFYTGNLKSENMPIYGPNPDAPCNIVRASHAESGVHDLGRARAFHVAEGSAFAGVHAFPARIKCATLGWHATIEALKSDPMPTTTESHTD